MPKKISTTMSITSPTFKCFATKCPVSTICRFKRKNTSTISPKPLSMVVIFCGTKTANTIW